jgi:hypothetical protein
VEQPSLSAIREAVKTTIGSSDPYFNKFGLFISRRNGRFPLKEIGTFYGMKEAAVSQAVRRFGIIISEIPSVNKKLQQVLTKLRLSNVET